MKSLKELLKALPGNILNELKVEKEKFTLNFTVKRVVLAVLFLIASTVLNAILLGVFGSGIISAVCIIIVVSVLLTAHQVLDRAVDKSAN